MGTARMIFDIFMALLAVVGLYGVLRGLAESCFLPRQVTAVVVLREAIDPAELDILLAEAARHPARRRGERVVLLVSPALMDGEVGQDGYLLPAYAAVVGRYHAAFCVGEPTPDFEKPPMGDPSQGDPSQGDPSQGDPSQGDPSQGDPSQGDPSQGDPSQGDPPQGDPSQSDPPSA